jgi:ketosteroid isomerase-like protein
MRASLLAVCIVTALSAGCSKQAPSPSAPAGSDVSAVRKDISDLQEKFRDAVRAKDADAVLALMTPDFQQTKKSGETISRAEAAKEMRASWPTILSIGAWTMDTSDLTVSGDTAQALVRDHMVLQVPDARGLPRTLQMNDTSRTTWKRTPAGWRYYRMKDEGASAKNYKDTSGLDFVPAAQWERESTRERRGLAAAKRRHELATAKPVARAAAGMTAAQTRQMLTDLYARYRSAVRRKDAGAALALLTEDYSVVANNTVIPRWQVEKDLRSDMARTQSIGEWTMTLQDIGVHDGAIVVVLKERRRATITGNGGRSQQVNVRDTMRDTWVKTPKGWQTQKTEMVSGG